MRAPPMLRIHRLERADGRRGQARRTNATVVVDARSDRSLSAPTVPAPARSSCRNSYSDKNKSFVVRFMSDIYKEMRRNSQTTEAAAAQKAKEAEDEVEMEKVACE